MKIFPFCTVCSGKNALAVTYPFSAYKWLISSIAFWMSLINTYLPTKGFVIFENSYSVKISDGETSIEFTKTPFVSISSIVACCVSGTGTSFLIS